MFFNIKYKKNKMQSIVLNYFLYLYSQPANDQINCMKRTNFKDYISTIPV